MAKFLFSVLFVTQIIFTTNLRAEVMAEGWYKLLLGQQHIGYIVQRFELDTKKNQVVMTSFLRTNTLGGDITESLKSFSTTGFEPIAYQYSILKGKEATLIDAKFSNGNATVKVTEKGETKTHKYKVPKGSFLSYYLGYVMTSFQNPKDANDKGIKVGRSFSYKAIAEEDGQLSDGTADVIGTEKINGHDTFRIRVKYKNIQSISSLTGNAETAQINQPLSGHQVKVATREEATRGFPSSDKSLKTLFNTVPSDSPLTKIIAAVATDSSEASQAVTSEPAKKLPPKLGVEPDLKVDEGSKILIPTGKGKDPLDPNNSNE